VIGLGAVADAYIGYLQAVADELVDIHWYLVESLAEELLARPTLSGMAAHRTLRATVERSSSDLNPWPDVELTPAGWRLLAFSVGRERQDSA
jgi:hypothetical protein